MFAFAPWNGPLLWLSWAKLLVAASSPAAFHPIRRGTAGILTTSRLNSHSWALHLDCGIALPLSLRR
ncbi:MAG: hypothetical protein DME71_03665 [Verrucomicrobia bacterium]|nr:MAG: hypothetical protein DME71_03665 [Verrucomicrobiota bacterium]